MSFRRTTVVWSVVRDQALRSHWEAGLSTSLIAAELGGFDHCQDGGRNAVIGRVKRHRDAAKTDADKAFWSREKSIAPHEQKVRTTRSARPGKPKTESRPKTDGETGSELTHEQKVRLIDSVPAPDLTTTREESDEAFRKRMLYGRFEGEPTDRLVSWGHGRHGGRRVSVWVPKCTESMPGMVPCGQSVVHRTARCVLHGGADISRIKLTGQDKTTATLQAAE